MKREIPLVQDIGRAFLFVGDILNTLRRTHGHSRLIYAQILTISIQAMGTVLFSGVFVGAILVLQFQLMLAKYDATVLLGGLNTSAILREVGPLIISFLLAGKIGAFTAAELASMRVTEQIDAIECLGTDSMQFLVVPRFIGIIVSSMILLTFALIVSIFSSMAICEMVFGINPALYLESIPKFSGPSTLIVSFTKCLAYSSIVACFSCMEGYQARGGARGVGDAVTKASTLTNFCIIIANFGLSLMFETLRGLI